MRKVASRDRSNRKRPWGDIPKGSVCSKSPHPEKMSNQEGGAGKNQPIGDEKNRAGRVLTNTYQIDMA